MSTISMPSVSQPTKPTPDTFFEKVGNALSIATQFVQKRCQEATEDFFFAVEREKSRPRLPSAIQAGSSARKARLCGFLVTEEASVVTPVFEGGNYFNVSPDGRLMTCAPASHQEFEYEIRVSGDATKLQDFQGAQTKDVYTNDRLELGGRPFILKMLPEKQRSEVEMEGARQ